MYLNFSIHNFEHILKHHHEKNMNTPIEVIHVILLICFYNRQKVKRTLQINIFINFSGV